MAKIVSSNEFDSEVLNSTVPVLVDFYADWCGPCKMLAPSIEELAEECEKSSSAKIVKVDIDKSNDIASKFHIMSIPTLLIFKDGQVFDQIIGFVPKSVIEQKLSAATK